jgi:hypothetical protein
MILQKPNEQQHSKTSTESANQNKLMSTGPDNSNAKSASVGLLMPTSSSSQMTNAFHKTKNIKTEKDDKIKSSESNDQISSHLDPNHIFSQLFLKAANENLMKKDINNNLKVPYNPQYNSLLSATNQNNTSGILQNFSANISSNFSSDYFFNHLQSLNNQTNPLYSQYDAIAYNKRLNELSSSLPLSPLSLSTSSASLNNRFFGANPILNSPGFSNKPQNKETKSCNYILFYEFLIEM